MFQRALTYLDARHCHYPVGDFLRAHERADSRVLPLVPEPKRVGAVVTAPVQLRGRHPEKRVVLTILLGWKARLDPALPLQEERLLTAY